MRLEIQSIDIHDFQPGSKTYAKDRVLYVDLKELKEILLKDSRIKSVDIHLVYPGDRVRIVNLLDVVQPRCKIDKVEADFPVSLEKCRWPEVAVQGHYGASAFLSRIRARIENTLPSSICPASWPK